jgi:tetratricopeptide (TPR) repeat protein/serine/threonine protein kinase
MLRKGDEPIHGYRLQQFLGRGAFGEVWRASGPGGTSAGMKFIDLGGKQGLKEYRAIQRVKEIRHAHLLPIYAFWMLDQHGDVLDDAELSVWDMEGSVLPAQAPKTEMFAEPRRPATLVVAMLLGDKSLSERLDECKDEGHEGIPIDELLDQMEDAAKGIDFLNSPRHDLGDGPVALQHCDIKPQNILLVGNSALVCDFGLARVLGADQRTKTGMAGSPAYMAPEVIRTRKPSRATDQYALAITYHELRTGQLPFDAESYPAVLDAHLRGKLDLSRLTPDERTIIIKATSLEPEDRFASSLDLARALRRVMEPPLDARASDSLSDSSRSMFGQPSDSPRGTMVNPGWSSSGSSISDVTPLADGAAKANNPTLPSSPALAAETRDSLAAKETAAITQSGIESHAQDSQDEDDAAPKPIRPSPAPAPQKASAYALQNRPRLPTEVPRERRSLGRLFVSLALLAAVGGGGYAAWRQGLLDPYLKFAKRDNDLDHPVIPVHPAEPDSDKSSNEQPAADKSSDHGGDKTRPDGSAAKITERVELHFSPTDVQVRVDRSPVVIDGAGTVTVARTFDPDKRGELKLAVTASRPDYRDFAATRTLDEWKASPEIRLEKMAIDYAKIGLDLLEKGQDERAVAALSRAVQEKQVSAEVYLGLGIVQSHLGRHSEAKRAFDEAIAMKPALAAAYRGRATAERELKHWNEAVADLNSALKHDAGAKREITAELTALYRDRTREAISDRRWTDALAYCKIVLDDLSAEPADRARQLALRGEINLGRNEANSAIDDFNAATKLDASLGESIKSPLAAALRQRAKVRGEAARAKALAAAQTKDATKRAEARADYQAVLEDLTAAIKLVANDESYSMRGFVRNELGDFSAAVADFDMALRLNGKNVSALHNRGFAYNALGERANAKTSAAQRAGYFEKAIEDFTKAIRLKPQDQPTAYNNRGFAYLMTDQFDEAIADYTKALLQSKVEQPATKNGLARAYRGRGERFLAKKDYDQALNDFRLAVEQFPALAESLKPRVAVAHAGRAYRLAAGNGRDKEKLDEALKAADQAISIAPDDPEGYAARGLVRLKQGESTAARSDYDKAVVIAKRTGANPAHYVNLLGLMRIGSDPNNAILDFTDAIKLDPKSKESYVNRARAYESRNYKGDAELAAADRETAKGLDRQSAPESPPPPKSPGKEPIRIPLGK